MKIKSLAILSTTALMLLCSCGTGGGGGNVDKTLPSDDPSSEVEVNFWHCLGHDKQVQLDRIIDKFNNDHKGSYKVVSVRAGSDYADLHKTITTKLATYEFPALAMGYPDSFAEYMTKNINTSYLLRIDNFLNDTNYGYTDAEKADFVEDFFEEGKGYQFPGTWSMPMYKSTEVMYFNRPYFEGFNQQNDKIFAPVAKGQEYPNAFGKSKEQCDTYAALSSVLVSQTKLTPALEQDMKALRDFCKANGGFVYDVPSTWTEMVATGRQMIADRASAQIDASANTFYPVGYDSDANMLISQFAQLNIPYTVNNEETIADPLKHFVFNNPDAKNHVKAITDLIKEKVLITKNALGGQTYTNDLFTKNQAAMVIGSTGGSSFNVSSNFLVQLAPVPAVNPDNKCYIQQGPSICFFNNDNNYVNKGAWLFYKYLADPQDNLSLALENSYDPVRNSSYTLKDYTDWTNLKNNGLKYAIPATTTTLRPYYYTSPTFIGSSTARTEIGEIITSVISKKMSIDDAFEQALNKCKQAA